MILSYFFRFHVLKKFKESFFRLNKKAIPILKSELLLVYFSSINFSPASLYKSYPFPN